MISAFTPRRSRSSENASSPREIPYRCVIIGRRSTAPDDTIAIARRQVSGVRTLGIVFSVFLRGRVEMCSCARESRTFALASGMNVNAMRAGRQLRNLYVNGNPAIGSADRRGTDPLSLRVDNIGVGGLCRRLSEHGGRPY